MMAMMSSTRRRLASLHGHLIALPSQGDKDPSAVVTAMVKEWDNPSPDAEKIGSYFTDDAVWLRFSHQGCGRHFCLAPVATRKI